MKKIMYSQLSMDDVEKMRRNEPLSIKESFALVYIDGVVDYFNNGVLHRDDGPAVVYPSGTEMWYRNGVLHRDDGPAAKYSDGGLVYAIYGKKHRLDGPAFIDESFSMWFINDKQVEIEDVLRIKNNIKNKDRFEEIKNLMLLKYQ